ncbi:hypothetical protein IW261DRAFT_221357 [Armillaria novae-zelandiae]|uniref:Uncharacterized protein n=1 Tax=Armillaria novae-zelandiae TaxID=153914 RepID=A0AA39P685_9AGAR|nr:hypothetical protein IW261DRAFT_221357 [Armillaria novae-zelandiae]
MILDRPPSPSSTILPDYVTSENARPPRYWTHERPDDNIWIRAPALIHHLEWGRKIACSWRHWWWGFGNVSLRWDCRTVLEDGSFMCICYAADDSRNPVLTVFPDGHQCFDHILISALIIERKMTMS